MATKKISELTAITEADDSDVLVVVDVSEGTTNKITKGNLLIGAGHSIIMEIDSNYQLTLKLKNAAGTELSTASIDLPNEDAITGITYSSGELVLTRQGGETSTVDISGLIDDLVTETTFDTFVTAIKAVIGISTNTYNAGDTYNIGDIVIQNEKIYKCKENNVTGTFDVTKWDEISLYEYQKKQDEKIDDDYKEIIKLKNQVEEQQNIINQMPTVNGNGTEITLNNTIEAGFTQFDIEGNSTQGGTPSPDNEVPILSAGDNGSITEKIYKEIFSQNEIEKLNAFINNDSLEIRSSQTTKTLYFPIKGGYKYIVSKTLGSRLRVGCSNVVPVIGGNCLSTYNEDATNKVEITTPSNAQYLLVTYYNSSADTSYTEQEILDSMTIESSEFIQTYTIPVQQPMRSIGDVRDVFFKNTVDSPYYDNTLTLNGWYERHIIQRFFVPLNWSWNISSTQIGVYNLNLDINNNYKTITKSNYYKGYTQYASEISTFELITGYIRLYNNQGFTTSAEVNAWLTELSNSGHPLYFDFVVKNSEIVNLPCTAEQKAILDTIPSTYKGQTRIYSEDTTPAYIEASGLYDTKVLEARVETNESNIATNTNNISHKADKYEYYDEKTLDDTSGNISWSSLGDEKIIAFKVIFRNVVVTDGNGANLSCNWRMKNNPGSSYNSSCLIGGISKYIHGNFILDKIGPKVYEGRYECYREQDKAQAPQNNGTFDNVTIQEKDVYNNDVISQITISIGGSKNFVSGKMMLLVQRKSVGGV